MSIVTTEIIAENIVQAAKDKRPDRDSSEEDAGSERFRGLNHSRRSPIVLAAKDKYPKDSQAVFNKI